MDWILRHLDIVPDLIDGVVALGIYAVKSELKHINETIKDAKETAAKAHARIDDILKSMMKD